MTSNRSDGELRERDVRELLDWETPSRTARQLVRHYVDLREEVKRHRKRGAELEELLTFERQMVVCLTVQIDEMKRDAQACVCGKRWARDQARKGRKESNGSGRHAG